MKNSLLILLFLFCFGCSTGLQPKNIAQRDAAINKFQKETEGKGVKISVEGQNKDVVRVKCFNLEPFQITQYLKDDLQNFADAGFKEIYIEDSTGEIQHINLSNFQIKSIPATENQINQ